MSTSLRGRHAVVTGGGAGLGAAIAAALWADGADVTVMGRTPATIEATAARLATGGHGRALAVTCDVSDATSVARAFEDAVRAMGPVHILINNAGLAAASTFADTTLASWNHVIAVNLTGTFLCTQQVFPAMLLSGGGRIINIASTAGLQGYARVSAYVAAKHGVVGLTRALAAESLRSGVTVNAVCPGYIEGSSMLETAIANVMRVTGKSADAARAILAKQSPGGSFVTAGEVAAKVLWLCSEEGSATTGQAMVVSGEEVPS